MKLIRKLRGALASRETPRQTHYAGSTDYVYKPPGNYGGSPPTKREYREAFEDAPACHHDHNQMAREVEEWLASLDEET